MKVGILAGTGLYELPGIEVLGEVEIRTPFGLPSDRFVHARVHGHDVYFLPRHGRRHTLLPSEINGRANVWALKSLGVDAVLSISAVGSLRADLHPRDAVVVDQFIDRSKNAVSHTFFGDGAVAHISFAHPVCDDLRQRAAIAARRAAGRTEVRQVFERGVYVQMEGPAFSTAAESRLHRSWGGDVIGMTALPEAKLCREAEICYAVVALVTDYDAGVEIGEPVTVARVIEHLQANAQFARELILEFLRDLPSQRPCPCHEALRDALVTRWEDIPPATRERLRVLLQRYIPRDT